MTDDFTSLEWAPRRWSWPHQWSTTMGLQQSTTRSSRSSAGSNAKSWVEFVASLDDLRSRKGTLEATAQFREHSFPEIDRGLMARLPTNEFSAANSTYWFEHELRQYPAHVLDHSALRENLDRLVLAVGRESQGYPCSEATWALGKALGRKPVELLGGHLGFIAHPSEFAQALMLNF